MIRVGACLLLASVALAGDKDVAEFLCEKGEKALRARDYDEAASSFRRALDEHTPYPEAAYGLGQALEKQGRAADAIDAYQQCLDQIGDPVPREWRSLRGRAAKAVSRLRHRYSELDELNREFIKRCLAFARDNARAHPAWARRAYEAVLALDPANRDARRRLAKLPDGSALESAEREAEPAPAKEPGWQPLITSDRLDDWDPGKRSGDWDCDKLVLTGEARGADGHLNWLDAVPLAGTYSIRVQCQVKEGDAPVYGIFIGDGRSAWWSVIVDYRNENIVLERFEGGRHTRATSAYLEDVDPSAWHTLLVEVEDDSCVVSLDGKKMYAHAGGAAFSGKLSLFVQGCTADFKGLELRK